MENVQNDKGTMKEKIVNGKMAKDEWRMYNMSNRQKAESKFAKRLIMKG
jgi:hypothetical protein